MRKIFATILTLAVLLSLTVGAAFAAEEETAPETEGEEAVEEEPIYIGEEEPGCYQVVLTNSTGVDIVGVAIKTEEDEEFPENMMEEDAVFQAEKTAVLYYGSAEMFGIALPESDEKAQAAEEITVDEEQGELEMIVSREIQLTFADETVCVLHAFPFTDLDEAEIFLTEDGVAYVVYVSLSTEETVDTSEAETAIKAEEDAAEELQLQAEEAAASNYADPYGGANNNDSCLSGALFW